MVLHKGVLPLLGGLAGEQVLQLLGGNEGNVVRHQGQNIQLREHGAQEGLGLTQGVDDGPHRLL